MMYLVCLVHNKIKVDDQWLKMQKPFKKWMKEIEMRSVARNINPPKVIVTACDECEYPYFG